MSPALADLAPTGFLREGINLLNFLLVTGPIERWILDRNRLTQSFRQTEHDLKGLRRSWEMIDSNSVFSRLRRLRAPDFCSGVCSLRDFRPAPR